MKIRVNRIYADADGVSHFADDEIELDVNTFAPPADPVLLSAWTGATRFAYLCFPAGWVGDWHPSPARQVQFFIRGEGIVRVSDGSQRRFGVGDVWLVEDLTGPGHHTVAIEECVAGVVRLEPE